MVFFCICRIRKTKKMVLVNLPPLILDGDPRRREHFFYWLLMPWTPEFNGIFCIFHIFFYKKCIQVNLPPLILDPESMGINLLKPFFCLTNLTNTKKYHWTQVSMAWVINRKNVILGVNYSFKGSLRFHAPHKVPFFRLEHHKLRMPVHVPGGIHLRASLVEIRHFLYVKKRKKEIFIYSPCWLIDSSSYCWVLLYRFKSFAILMKRKFPNKAWLRKQEHSPFDLCSAGVAHFFPTENQSNYYDDDYICTLSLPPKSPIWSEYPDWFQMTM